jgi:cytochrome c-type biogenesis protein CcmH
MRLANATISNLILGRRESPSRRTKSEAVSGRRRAAYFLRAFSAPALAVFLALTAMQMHPAVAVQPDEILKDQTLEARARGLSRELRCMVCQNQSIDDSDAPLARDLRLLVRERLTAGDSDSQVIDFLVARYGEFVLLRPRFAWHNAVLWLTPLVVLIAGAIGIFLAARRQRSTAPAAVPLSAEEERRLAEVIDQGS